MERGGGISWEELQPDAITGRVDMENAPISFAQQLPPRFVAKIDSSGMLRIQHTTMHGFWLNVDLAGIKLFDNAAAWEYHADNPEGKFPKAAARFSALASNYTRT